jgi:hypothetical protein
VFAQGSAYTDGHERADVKRYRTKFVEAFAKLQHRMETYEGPSMETVVPPALNPGEKQVVLVTQDESAFAAHDGKKKVWQEQGKKQLRPKGDGGLHHGVCLSMPMPWITSTAKRPRNATPVRCRRLHNHYEARKKQRRVFSQRRLG